MPGFLPPIKSLATTTPTTPTTAATTTGTTGAGAKIKPPHLDPTKLYGN